MDFANLARPISERINFGMGILRGWDKNVHEFNNNINGQAKFLLKKS